MVRFSAGFGGLLVAACCLVAAFADASEERRGGNHGCDVASGTFYSSDFWDAGDKISFGLAFQPALPGPGQSDQDVLRAENTSRTGEGPAAVTCSADVGTWMTVTSELGPGDDRVRFDAKGLETEDGQGPYGPLPKDMTTVVTGGPGDDVIRGHKGFDNIRAGSGDDVLNTDDGKADNVNCGNGRDRANVDSKDDLKSCEETR